MSRLLSHLPRTIFYGSALSLLVAGCGDEGTREPEADAGADGSGAAVACGDGVLSPAEECESFDLRGAGCLDRGFESGRLSCSSTCTIDETLCVRCGDGIVGGSEACDTTVASSITCESIRGVGATGTLSCAPDCTAVVDDGCADAEVDTPFAPCDVAADDCVAPMQCVATELGALCVEPCEGAGDCAAGEYCAPVGDSVSTCLPRPAEGQQCSTTVPCVEALACVPAFGTPDESVSFCARGCDACTSTELCVPVPSGAWDLESDATCDPLTVTACSTAFDCVDIDDGEAETLRCARPFEVCAVPQQMYGFGAEGPTDDQICDLAAPTGGGRLCGLPELTNGATAICYPVFGANERLGACIGLCDDSTLDGFGDADCGDGWSCSTPAAAGLFYPQLNPPSDCTDADRSNCVDGYPDCIDLGDGPTCVRAARICAIDEATR